MQIKSKWKMRGHFKYLLQDLIWCLFVFPIKVLNIHNSCTNATPKVGVHLGVIGFHPLHFPHLWKCVSHLNTFFWPHGLCISRLVMNPMLRLWHQYVTKNGTMCYYGMFIKIFHYNYLDCWLFTKANLHLE